MSGFIRNLFGNYYLYDSKDYEDLTKKLLFTEKWAVFISSSLATYDVLFSRDPPKGFFPIAHRVFRIVGPVVLGTGAFVGTLYASAVLRGKKDDEWNSFFATLVSGAAFCTIRRTPETYMMYITLVGISTNIYKQAKLNNWTILDSEAVRKHRRTGHIFGPHLVDWTLVDERPRRWINGDELKKEQDKEI